MSTWIPAVGKSNENRNYSASRRVKQTWQLTASSTMKKKISLDSQIENKKPNTHNFFLFLCYANFAPTISICYFDN